MIKFSSISETKLRERLSAAFMNKRLRMQIIRDLCRGLDEFIIYGGMAYEQFRDLHESRRAWNNRWYVTR